MNEISNRSLALLLIVAIVISFAGTMVSLSQIQNVKNRMAGSGLIVRGETNLTANKVIDINLTSNFINFPAGFVSNGSARAYLVSNKTCENWSGSCSGVVSIIVENYGSVDVNVTFNSTQNATGFLCNETGDCLDGSQRFLYWTNNTLANSCPNDVFGTQDVPLEVNASTDGESFISPQQGVCGQLQAGNNYGVYFNVALTVPKDVYGRKSVTLNFYSAESTVQS